MEQEVSEDLSTHRQSPQVVTGFIFKMCLAALHSSIVQWRTHQPSTGHVHRTPLMYILYCTVQCCTVQCISYSEHSHSKLGYLKYSTWVSSSVKASCIRPCLLQHLAATSVRLPCKPPLSGARGKLDVNNSYHRSDSSPRSILGLLAL